MLEFLFSYSQREFLFVIVYISAMLMGVYISQKHNIQPISTLLLILICSTTYLVITNILIGSAQQHFSDEGGFKNPIILLGIIGTFLVMKFFKRFLRIPSIISHYILILFLLFFSFFQVNEFLYNNPDITYTIFNIPLSNGIGSINLDTFQLSASLYPELISNDTMFLELLIALMVMLSYLLFTQRFKYPGNRFLFTMLLLMVLLFISLFKLNPSTLPALSDRMIGMNVVQWGLILAGLLLSAYIISKEMSTYRYKREVLRKAPSEYTLLLVFLSLVLISFQLSSLFQDSEMKVLIIGYFITTSFIATFFLRRIEKHYLRYGTISIILIIFIILIQWNIRAGSGEVNDIQKEKIPDNFSDPAPGDIIIKSSSNTDLANSASLQSSKIDGLSYMSPNTYRMRK